MYIMSQILPVEHYLTDLTTSPINHVVLSQPQYGKSIAPSQILPVEHYLTNLPAEHYLTDLTTSHMKHVLFILQTC